MRIKSNFHSVAHEISARGKHPNSWCFWGVSTVKQKHRGRGDGSVGKSAYHARLTTWAGIPGTHSRNPDTVARACNLSTQWGMAGGKRRLSTSSASWPRIVCWWNPRDPASSKAEGETPCWGWPPACTRAPWPAGTLPWEGMHIHPPPPTLTNDKSRHTEKRNTK